MGITAVGVDPQVTQPQGVKDGDFALLTTTGKVYGPYDSTQATQAAMWPEVVGSDLKGPAGATWHIEAVPNGQTPTTTGKVGDYLLDSNTSNVWGPYDPTAPAGTRWGAGAAANIRGARSHEWYYAPTMLAQNWPPTVANSQAGDLYLIEDTGDVYIKGAGGWPAFGSPDFNLQGPQGAGISIKGTGDAAAVEALIQGGTPASGDAYILSGTGPHDLSSLNAALSAVPTGHLVAFDGTDWADVGQIQGPAGAKGAPGTRWYVSQSDASTFTAAAPTPVLVPTSPPPVAGDLAIIIGNTTTPDDNGKIFKLA